MRDLQKGGALGIATFWLVILAACLSTSSTVRSIVHLARASSKIWRRATGSSILVTNVFIMFCSLASLAFQVLAWRRIALPEFLLLSPFQWFIVFTFIAQFLYCVLLTLTTDAMAHEAAEAIRDFCERYIDDPAVVEFLAEYTTQDLLRDFVAGRTSGQYTASAAFFAVWLPATVALAVCTKKLDGGQSPAAVKAVALQDSGRHPDPLPVAADDDDQ
jgi:hypothetical protein